MIKSTTNKIVGQPNVILNLKKMYNETPKNIPTVSQDLIGILKKISVLIFFQFYFKINRNQLEIVVKVSYGLHHDQYSEILNLNLAVSRFGFHSNS